MSKRTILSRPRTRLYDVNYNIGESLYRPALERLDRKYSGRPLSPPPRPSIPQDLLDRHERAFADEDINDFRRRAEKSISGRQLFDSRGARIDAAFENDFDDEVSSKIKSIRASKRISKVDDVDMESTVNNLNSRRLLDRSEKILDSVGINDRALSENVSTSFRSRALHVKQAEDDLVDSRDLTKWSSIKDRRSAAAAIADVDDRESAAALRMKQTKARLNDLEEEMEALAERQAAREKRAARLKALVAETASADDLEPAAAIMRKSVRIRAREVQEDDADY